MQKTKAIPSNKCGRESWRLKIHKLLLNGMLLTVPFSSFSHNWNAEEPSLSHSSFQASLDNRIIIVVRLSMSLYSNTATKFFKAFVFSPAVEWKSASVVRDTIAKLSYSETRIYRFLSHAYYQNPPIINHLNDNYT